MKKKFTACYLDRFTLDILNNRLNCQQLYLNFFSTHTINKSSNAEEKVSSQLCLDRINVQNYKKKNNIFSNHICSPIYILYHYHKSFVNIDFSARFLSTLTVSKNDNSILSWIGIFFSDKNCPILI